MVERQRGDEGNVGVEMKVVFEDGDGDGVERVTVVSAVVMMVSMYQWWRWREGWQPRWGEAWRLLAGACRKTRRKKRGAGNLRGGG
ncbi:hypothetical protein Tco_1272088 [Tanacetum coccineum]